MHVHQSLWKGETNLFYDKADYAELSELGRYYIGGLLTHAWALCGLCARPRTPIGVWCRVTKLRSTWSIPAESLGLLPDSDVFAEPAGKARRSSVRRIPPAIPT